MTVRPKNKCQSRKMDEMSCLGDLVANFALVSLLSQDRPPTGCRGTASTGPWTSSVVYHRPPSPLFSLCAPLAESMRQKKSTVQYYVLTWSIFSSSNFNKLLDITYFLGLLMGCKDSFVQAKHKGDMPLESNFLKIWKLSTMLMLVAETFFYISAAAVVITLWRGSSEFGNFALAESASVFR